MKSLICGTLLLSMSSHLAFGSDRPIAGSGIPHSPTVTIPSFGGGISSGSTSTFSAGSFEGSTTYNPSMTGHIGTGGLNLPPIRKGFDKLMGDHLSGDPMIE